MRDGNAIAAHAHPVEALEEAGQVAARNAKRDVHGVEADLFQQQVVNERADAVTDRIADGLAGTKLRLMDTKFRAPYILSLGFAGGLPAGLVDGLAEEGVYVAARLARMRISPHVFNDEEDADRFVAALKRRI